MLATDVHGIPLRVLCLINKIKLLSWRLWFEKFKYLHSMHMISRVLLGYAWKNALHTVMITFKLQKLDVIHILEQN